MKVLIVNNIPREGPGILQDILEKNNIEFDIYEYGKDFNFPLPENYEAIVVLGGPDSANDETDKIIKEIEGVKKFLEKEIPYFGICLGLQIMVKALGGKVIKNPIKEVGWRDPEDKLFKVNLTKKGINDPIFEGIKKQFTIFQLHGETISMVPEMNLLGTGKYCKNQVVKYGKYAYGFQGHIELTSDMFYDWIKEDDDLKKLDKNKLKADYHKFKKEYELNGEKILKNFLSISGFKVE